MVAYTTTAFLRDLIQYVKVEKGEAGSLRKSFDDAKQRSPHGTTFLSYSSKDEELIPIVVRLLENQGATVYVDTRDGTLASKGPKEIADTLRSRIRQTRKFVLFATDNSKDSKWVPWELGLADGFKNAGGVAIFPAVENLSNTEWTEREYLGVYDRIVFGKLEGYDDEVWMVWNFRENSAVTLRAWLAS